MLGEVLRDNRGNRDGTGWDGEEASTFQRCARPPGFHIDVTLCAGRGFRVIIEVMETGRNGTGSGKNLSLVLKVPRQHIYDWFSAGMIIEIIRARWDGMRRGKNLLAVRKIPKHHINDWFNAGRCVSG